MSTDRGLTSDHFSEDRISAVPSASRSTAEGHLLSRSGSLRPLGHGWNVAITSHALPRRARLRFPVDRTAGARSKMRPNASPQLGCLAFFLTHLVTERQSQERGAVASAAARFLVSPAALQMYICTYVSPCILPPRAMRMRQTSKVSSARQPTTTDHVRLRAYPPHCQIAITRV